MLSEREKLQITADSLYALAKELNDLGEIGKAAIVMTTRDLALIKLSTLGVVLEGWSPGPWCGA